MDNHTTTNRAVGESAAWQYLNQRGIIFREEDVPVTLVVVPAAEDRDVLGRLFRYIHKFELPTITIIKL
jgi:hypothetical protein